ncbi:MAG TPA: hypothetical protein VGX78_13890, partial [Pirellulales bacterium]|nr:hypothetical protein [Pirellulales bacterium]
MEPQLQPSPLSGSILARPATAHGAPTRGAAWRRWFAERWVVWLAAAFLAGMAFPFFRRGAQSEWQTCYVRAGERMLA